MESDLRCALGARAPNKAPATTARNRDSWRRAIHRGLRICPGTQLGVGGGRISRFIVPLQPLQIGSHFRSVLVAQIAILLESLVDDLFQLGRNVGIQRTAEQAPGSEWLRKSSSTFATEGQLAGRHLVENGAKGETDPCGNRAPSRGPARATYRRRCREGRIGQVDRSGTVSVFVMEVWLEELAVGTTLARPKSRILACPRLVTKCWRA